LALTRQQLRFHLRVLRDLRFHFSFSAPLRVLADAAVKDLVELSVAPWRVRGVTASPGSRLFIQFVDVADRCCRDRSPPIASPDADLFGALQGRSRDDAMVAGASAGGTGIFVMARCWRAARHGRRHWDVLSRGALGHPPFYVKPV
jgi:hypothetical protein